METAPLDLQQNMACIYSNQKQGPDTHRNNTVKSILPLQPILLLFILTATDISNCFPASSPLLDTTGITENGVSW